MKKRLSKIFSGLLITVLAVSLAVTSVNAEEPDTYAAYDKSFSYNGNVQTYTVPASGYYKLEVWGASGGDITLPHAWLASGEAYNVTAYGGRGGYSVGYKYLEAGQNLFICIGQEGKNGWNGNGEFGEHAQPSADPNLSSYWAYNGGAFGWDSAGGGGATHIAIGTNRGELQNYVSNISEVLIVAGGGGGCAWGSGYYTENEDSEKYDVPIRGGSGGGLTGGTGEHPTDARGVIGSGTAIGGTQSQSTEDTGVKGYFGRGGTPGVNAGGGGGGFYGGYGGVVGPGGGGSGYIGGCLSTLSYNGGTYTSNTAMSNNSGNGRAVITYLGPIYYRQKVQVSYENGDGTFTEYEDVVNEDFAQDSTFTWTREADETYRKASVSYTVAGAKTTQVKVYRQQYTLTIEKGDGIDSVTGEGEYRAGQAVTIEAKVKEGYEFNGWSESEILMNKESTVEFEMPANDLHYTAVAEAVKHSTEEDNIPGDSTGGNTGKEDNIPGDSTGGNAENDSEDESSVQPLPTPAPARTRIIAPANNTAHAEDEEVQIEVEELALAPVPAPLPSVNPALRSSIIKGGSIHIPLAYIDTSGTDRERYDYSFWSIAAVIACVVGIGGIILFIYYLFFRKYKIYDSQTDELIGISFIRKDERDMFWAKISDAVCEKAGSKIYIIMGENFVRSNPEKPLKVSARGKDFYRQIREKIDIEFAQK